MIILSELLVILRICQRQQRITVQQVVWAVKSVKETVLAKLLLLLTSLLMLIMTSVLNAVSVQKNVLQRQSLKELNYI